MCGVRRQLRRADAACRVEPHGRYDPRISPSPIQQSEDHRGTVRSTCPCGVSLAAIPARERRRNLIFVSMGVSMVAAALKQRIPCPACGKPVGSVRTRSADGRRIEHARCPNCGLSLDSPKPEQASEL